MFDTLTLAQTVAHISKSSFPAAADRPLLTGHYEVIIPFRNEGIFFTDSLHEAARHVARARYPDQDRTKEVLAFLEAVEQHGFLRSGEHGVRIHRPLTDGTPWMAKVRGAQVRPQPKYALDDVVVTTDDKGALPSSLKPGRVLHINGITVVNDNRPGKQYGYTVGGGAGQRVSEDRLRPINAVTGELDFDSLSD